MRKSLVAMAALAAAGSACAQSSVTLFGVVDAAVSGYSAKSSFYSTSLLPAFPPAGQPDTVKRSQTALSNSGYNNSRLGFRGTEDLGGGLAASFWLESPLFNDSGAAGLSTFGRRSTVSLSGGFGELRLGRDFTPSFWSDTVFDPMGATGVGTNLISSINSNLAIAASGGTLNGGLSGGTDSYVRTSNAIGYFLPPNLGGFYGQVQYALHENTKSTDVSGSPSRRGRYIGGRFGYGNGPLDVALAYGDSTAQDATTTTAAGLFASSAERKIATTNLGASYDFGVLKLFGELSRVRDEAGTTVPVGTFGRVSFETSDKYDGALLGVSVPVGVGLLRAAYSRVKFKDDPGLQPPGLFAPNRDASAGKLALGYVHNLSKRTALYATLARIRIRNGQNNPAVMGATTGGSPAYLSTGTSSGFAPRSATGYDFGIRHAF
ncbi:porin [Variovorax soli]|uniref:Porin n=1 Tax=Variovorax soli TaxID=376815 RepID=A0ABU1ND83_9BURK|nr:porin [Variovorax soli]MDR6536412.1 putative porin [Variovorax soli]